MERRINRKIEDYISSFKDELRNKISSLDIDDKEKAQLLVHVYEYPRLTLDPNDVVKRKRVKNVLPTNNRCNAKRANGEQCTRRRKDNCEFCGTHSKGTPHGIIADEVKSANTVSVVMRMEQINGIVHHIDNFNNVYSTEDIMTNNLKPSIVGKYDVIKGITMF